MDFITDEASSGAPGYDVALVGKWRPGEEPCLSRLVDELQRRQLAVWHPRSDFDWFSRITEAARTARVVLLVEPDSLVGPGVEERDAFISLVCDISSERLVAVLWKRGDDSDLTMRSFMLPGVAHSALSRVGDAREIEALVAEIQERLERLLVGPAAGRPEPIESASDAVRSARLGRILRAGKPLRATCELSADVPDSPDAVNFSMFAPSSITPGGSFILDLWAHLGEQTRLVEGYAREIGRDRKLGVKAGVQLERGTVIEAALELPGFELPDPFEPLVWTGEPANCSFPARAPPQVSPGSHPGVVRLSVGAIPVARVHFAVQVQAQTVAPEPARCAGGTAIPRSAFACYSSLDRDEVLGRVHGMLKVLPKLDVFVDVLELRSGEEWERTIRPHIHSKDVFYLFWSAPASRSKEVEREWRCALEMRGVSYIDPVPLADPREAPPPDELKSLHFGDRFLAHVEVHRRIKRMKRAWWNPFGS